MIDRELVTPSPEPKRCTESSGRTILSGGLKYNLGNSETQHCKRKIRKRNVTSLNSSANRSSPGPTLGTSPEEFCQMAQGMQWLVFFSLSVPVSSPRYSWIFSPLLSSLSKSLGLLRKSWKKGCNMLFTGESVIWNALNRELGCLFRKG